MVKARSESEDSCDEGHLREQIKVWQSIGRATELGCKGVAAIVVWHDECCDDGKGHSRVVSISGTLDPEVLLAYRADDEDGEISHGAGLIVGRHLKAMAAEVVEYLECRLPDGDEQGSAV